MKYRTTSDVENLSLSITRSNFILVRRGVWLCWFSALSIQFYCNEDEDWSWFSSSLVHENLIATRTAKITNITKRQPTKTLQIFCTDFFLFISSSSLWRNIIIKQNKTRITDKHYSQFGVHIWKIKDEKSIQIEQIWLECL